MSVQEDQILQIVEVINSSSIDNNVQFQNDKIQTERNNIPIQLEDELQTESNQIIEENGLRKTLNNVKDVHKNQIEEKKVENIISKQKKVRRIVLYKCKVCKTTGKKSQVKMCSKCKFHFHRQCLDPEKIVDQNKAFVCQICEKPIEKIQSIQKIDKKTLQSQKQLKSNAQSQKIPQPINPSEKQRSTGFLNISKLLNVYRSNFKKDEWKRKLYQFYKRYPYCFQKNKIVFPVQDHLLHIYQSIFPSYCKTTTARPKPSFQTQQIPTQYYNELFEIQIFFVNFWQELKSFNFFKPLGNKEQKQFKLADFTRINLYKRLVPQGMNELYVWVLQTFLRMYLNDIMDRNRIDNMKYISSNPFFNLLATINQNQGGLTKEFVIKSAPQIIKNLTKIPSFRRSFLCQFDDQQLHQLHYPKKLTCKNKIDVITKLIRGLCDTDCFKQIVMKKAELISQLTKQKGQTLIAQKSLQNQNLPLRQKIKQLQKQLKQLAFSDPKQYAKKYESSTKKLQKFIITHKNNNQKIQQLRQKVKQIARRMPFVNSVVKFLGIDRFQSQYFFNKNQKTKIYIKYRQSLLSEQINNTFSHYEGKQQIQQLKNWLNTKGTNEKNLSFNIHNLEQKDLLSFQNIITQHNDVIQNIQSQIQDDQRLQSLEYISRQQNIQDLISCENLFKQTLHNSQTIQQRQTQMSQLFIKLSFHNDKKQQNQKYHSQQITQIQYQHPLKTLFSKYPAKLWNWNQKVKKFWFQFLDIYISDQIHQTQSNLMILTTVWKMAIKLHHSQAIKKRQKILKRIQKEKIIKEKQQELIIQQQIQFQQNSSPQQNWTPQLYNQQKINTRRRLRKRQNTIDFKQNDDSPNESINGSSKKDSTPQESSKLSSKPEFKTMSKTSSKTQKKQSTKPKGRPKKDTKKKLQIGSQSELAEQKLDPSDSSNKQNQQNRIQDQSSPYQQQSQELSDPQQVSPQQQFCQQCFENVNFDKSSKIKIVLCQACPKVYHKKCLDQDDSFRLKKQQNNWKCDNCWKKLQKCKGINSTISNSINTNQKQKKVIDNEKPQQIVLQTINIKQNGSKDNQKINKLALIVNQNGSSQKSKTLQKAEKKQRKKIEQESKIQQLLENSESMQKQMQKQPKKSKKSKGKQIKNGKKEVNRQRSEKVNRQRSEKNKNLKQKNKSINPVLNHQNMNTSNSSQRRSTRDKSNRKKIVEQSSYSEQENSESYSEIQS